ncbi:transcription antitermination NusB family protein [Limnoglobus roseus]|uniref:Alpha-2-macroglobulin domain-containing protein n=1 Tax=Limnoglobus roseus TaxID=2598579 RepID=A0A5C1A965_9BACT|nr:hypothetical protein [Limnoglobus roseus]QEL15260.1 hypothetical protein PX52LOC_02175 [Limnoglobus roseus]
MFRLSLGIAVMTAFAAGGFAADVPFAEDFALAKDRAAVLKQLIPGTEDYYYYHCLHYLNTEQFEKLEGLQKPWLERHGRTQRFTEIQTRQMLLTYERDPKKVLDYVRGRVGVQFNHTKDVLGVAPNLPTALDPKRIARDTLLADSLRRWSNLDNFEDSALDWLAGTELGWEKRRLLLQRLRRPDVPKLLDLIDADLKAPHAGGFGSLNIHTHLTLAQLDEVLKARPDLLNNEVFVNAYLVRLHPGADSNWKRDRKLALAFLERLQAFVGKLPASYNSLKAHVLYHRLAFDRANGEFDKDRFVAYLKLPRRQPYMAKAMLESEASKGYPADLNTDFVAVTLMPPVYGDEELVRSYLAHFLVAAPSPKEFEPYFQEEYLRHVFAETKAVNGLGDADEWAAKLPPELFRAIKERIDIDFAYTNKADYAADEPVKLGVAVKNVSSLLVKVFEINTVNVYRATQKEIDTDITLDGLVANSEKVYAYTEAPLRRVDRTFEFPELTKPGVYVIDFIGGGKSSRALIRKGRLRPIVTVGTAGENVRVVDEANRPVADATVWLGGTEYTPDKDGVVTVPYSTAPGRRPIVIRRGSFASIDSLDHKAETYNLVAGFHVDRESLLTQRLSQLIVRPGLYLDGRPVSVKVLDEVKLRITSVDLNNISTSLEVPDFKLFEDRESTYDLRVPGRTTMIVVQLTARVKNLSTAKTVDLSAAYTFALNEIDRTDKVEDLHLAKFGGDYAIELLGRTGEAKPDRAVSLSLKHKDFREPVSVSLKTDAKGRVNLGSLPDIATVTATGPEGTSHTWTPATDQHTYRQLLHAKAGDVVTVPYLGTADRPTRAEFALFELVDGTIRADKFDSLAIANGLLELRGLAAGDYDLYLKARGEKVRVRVVDGTVQNGYVLNDVRQMELPGLKPVAIRDITTTADDLVIRLTDGSKFARVHLFATRYQPAYSAFADLGVVRDAELSGVYPGHAVSVYQTGRNIGDEYRYVLERKAQKKYPGNMLDRPQLLLNPWAIRPTTTGEQMAEGGDSFRRAGGATPPQEIEKLNKAINGGVGSNSSGFANLDFLADASTVVVNLVPDKDGVIRVPRRGLGPQSMIHVVAVDPLSTTVKHVTLPEQDAKFLDLRLANGLDPAKHFTQQKQVSVLNPGQVFTLNDITGSRFQLFDSTAKVYGLYATLSKDPKLTEFAFILTWPKLTPDEKRATYSKYSSHELNFFLARKDREFFAAVVRPYLANKKDKTFLDHYLLDQDIGEYLKPWNYNRLNSVERVLLAQRIANEPARTSRHFDDLLRLLPPRTDRDIFLFDTAVSSGGLGDDTLNRAKSDRYREIGKPLPKKSEDAPQRGADPFAATPPPAAMPAPGGGPGGPAGGMGGFGAGGGRRSGEAQRESLERELKKESAQRDGRAKQLDDAKKDMKAGNEDFSLKALNEADKEAAFFDQDAKRKLGAVRQLYRQLDPTMEWAEDNYYHLPIAAQLADLVPVSPFWLDYSRHTGDGPFLSPHLADASRNFTEMMFALAVIDLPADAGQHEMKFNAGTMTLTAAGRAIAFHEEVRPADGQPGAVPILVSQNFYRNGDRFKDENGERLDKFVTGEFLTQTVYGCQVVVTNPTSSRQKLTALVQLPVGAVPVANGQFTKTVVLDLEPYRTATVDYFFYFPTAGTFPQFPLHVGKAERFVAATAPVTFTVVDKPTKPDTTSWAFVSQNGTNEDVLAFLGRENVRALNLDAIAFRLKDRGFFDAVTKLLQDRHLYHPTTWSYALLHADLAAAKEYLQHADGFVNEVGGPIVSPLLVVDPVVRHQYEHLEYKPLVNARAHALGKRRQIVNDRFHAEYAATMKGLTYRRDLTDADKLAVTYYLLLQDRVDEAFATFGGVNAEKVPTKMQYDYCAAYLDFYREDTAHARSVAMKYANYPVDKWKNTFAPIVSQLDEAEGKAGKVLDPDDRNQQQGRLAATEPSFEFAVENKAINLSWQNVEAVTVNYYEMDVELLFSRNPFVQQSGGQFASIRPNATKVVKLPAAAGKTGVPIDPAFLKKNVLVEVVAAGKTRSAAYYANAMDVTTTESYGQVRVADAAGAKPLSKVYVKVYAKLADGTVKFHKDGYTDLRGRFDYASVSTPERQPVTRFAVLILSDDQGATIREVNPPQQ